MELQQIIQTTNIDTRALQQAFHQLIIDRAVAFRSSAWETTQTDKLRQQILDQIVFRGIPEKWIHHQTRVVQAETIQTGNHYEIQKVRLEILPDLWIPGLLYFPLQSLDPEPESRMPAVLSVNGHIGYPGKSTGFVQRRCINLAKRGIVTLHLEWFEWVVGLLSRYERRLRSVVGASTGRPKTDWDDGAFWRWLANYNAECFRPSNHTDCAECRLH